MYYIKSNEGVKEINFIITKCHKISSSNLCIDIQYTVTIKSSCSSF